VDAVIIDMPSAVGFMEANPGKLKIAGPPITSGELLAFVFPPLSDLIAPVNWAMQQMFADGTLDELCMKWTANVCDAAAAE
jgi:ABC-type amino acid transport substrate-binding protein